MPVQVQNKLNQMIVAVKRIIEIAESDGIITEEEKNIIEIATRKLDEYTRLVSEALADGIIDQDEKNALINLEEELMSDTYYQALDDHILEHDELLLLRTLYKTVDPRASVSWLDEDLS